jgi:hypothetical protein
MSIEDMANRQAIEFMEKTKDTAGLEAFKEAAELNSEKNVAQWAENAIKRLSQETEIAKTTPEYQTTQLEKLSGSNEEIMKRTEEVDNNIELVKTDTENQIKKLNTKDGEYVPYEEVKNEEKSLNNNLEKPVEKVEQKIENKEEVIKSSEIREDKPLQPGDEIFSDGKFYKIYNISRPSNEEIEATWERDRPKRDEEFREMTKMLPYKEGSDNFFQERKKFDEQKKKELDQPKISALVKGGPGTIAQEMIELDEKNVIRIDTPEQREKIVEMQKEEEETENRAAKAAGFGSEKKMVDKIIGHPGKF